MDSQPREWPLEETRRGAELGLFRLRHDRRRNPRNGVTIDALVLETADWVNVVALTPRSEVVLVRQFRFGNGRVTLEIPGGVITRGEPPLEAAKRELREETGYVARRWTALGPVEPNPAFHDNLCHQYLAEDAELAGALELDPGEDIAVELLPLDEVVRRVRSGEIRHSLVLTALMRVADLRRPNASDAR
jgi:8-oxo-dGTP pyrophosphatase MutT (NUDIX family)